MHARENECACHLFPSGSKKEEQAPEHLTALTLLELALCKDPPGFSGAAKLP